MALLGLWKKDKQQQQAEQTFSLPTPSSGMSGMPQMRSSASDSPAPAVDMANIGFNDETLVDLDKPPKPPEFDITGPEFPSDDELPPLGQSKQDKPVHIDDLSTPPTEAPLELPRLEQPEQQMKAEIVPEPPAIPSQPPQEQEPMELPELGEDLQPLDHEVYPAPQLKKPAPMPEQAKPKKHIKFKPQPESVQVEPGPLFVNMEGYQQILGAIAQATGVLRQADSRITALGDRSKEEGLHLKFQTTLDQAERKLMYIDETLFGGKQYGGN